MYYTYYKQRGNKILTRYKKPNDPTTYQKVVDFYKPKLYQTTTQESEWKSIYDKNLKPIEFDSINAAKDFAEKYKNVPAFGLNGNSDYANQFIIELCDGKQPEYEEQNIRIGFVDIEVHAPEFPKPEDVKYPVNAITIYDSVAKKFYTFGLEYEGCGGIDFSNLPDDLKEEIKGLDIEYFPFSNENDLLRSFLQHIQETNYDIVSGWNSEGFDVPYIINRCFKLFGEKFTKGMLSPFGEIRSREMLTNYGKRQTVFNITGLSHLDYMALYRKHTYIPRESYKLDFIAHEELGRRKVSYEESESLHDLYLNDYQRFIVYNIVDVNLMVQLDRKLGLFSLVFAMSYYSLSNFEDQIGTVRIWEQLIAKFLYTKNKVPPFNKTIGEEREFEGAYVKEPVKGFHEWIVQFDLNSLYPHIEQQWNIGPETHININKIKELVLGKIEDELRKYD